MERRVLITGQGVISGMGIGMDALWAGLVEGRTAVKRIARFDPSGFPCRLAAEATAFTSAKDFVPKHYRKAVKVMARDSELAVAAAKLAVEDAGLVTRGTLPEDSHDPTTYPPSRMGCHIGAGLIAAETEELTAALSTAKTADGPEDSGGFSLRAWGTEQGPAGPGASAMNNLPPLWLLKYLPNMLACHVTIIHGTEGPSNTITCAEASGLLSIGESVRVIERGDADLCFSGGAEAPINLMRFLRMDLAGRLAHASDSADPGAVVRPYDADAPGGILGEGGGILVLEDAKSAAARGAKASAEVVGFGAAHSGWGVPGSDAPDDEGLVYAIENALDDAGIKPDAIDAIVPHAAGIREFDSREAAALKAVFGARLPRVPLVTLTPAIGDCLASNGSLAVAVGARCLKEQRLPSRIHAGKPVSGLAAGAARSEAATLRYVLVCTNALGGQNAAVVLKSIA